MDRRLEVKAAECFQRQRYAEAAQVYTQCLEKAEDKICRINLLLNRASCYLKEAKFDEAQSDCDEVLTHDEENEKALWKKVKVLCFRGQFQEAHDLATDWIGRDPENQIAQRELRRLEIVMSALKDQEVEFEGSETVHILTDPVITEVRPTPEGRESVPQSSPTSNPSIAIPSLIMLAKNAATPEDEVQQKPSDGILENQEKQETQNSSPDHDNTDKKSNSGLWKHRPPPRGLTSEEYTMCVRFQETGRCMFGDKCTLAHSELELAEWRERFDCRRQRLQEERDNSERGSSGIEQLQERLLGTENPEEVIVESLEAVKVNCNNMLKVDMSSKKCSHSWLFTLTSRLCLRRVMLLDDTYRSYFHISSISKGPKKSQKHQTIDNKCQEWFALDDTDPQAGDSVYRLKIVFKADIYGTFRQTVVLDYGTLPMLAQTVQVDSAPPEEGSQFTQELVSTSGNRWDTNSINLVSFEPRHQRSLPMEEKLKTMYSCPHPEKFSLSRALFEPLSKENYRRRMHELLFIEEMEQYGSIARYNLRATLQLVNRFLLIPGTLSTAKYAHNGELFARMKIESDLSEDSMHGRLILQNCQTAWIMADKKGGNSDPKPTAYEAIIEDKGKNFIFLRMSSDCVAGLQLTCDQEFKAQVQFQLNRLPLCEMHYGVDKLPSVGYVFPDLSSSPDIPWTPDRQWTNMECKLNAKQKEAVIGITSPLSVRLPPILLCGPYGTGKTYTLAQATKHVLKDADTHVLICTHSNSAADLYIKDFLHPYVCAGHDEATPLRIYYRHRWRQTVPETVLPYCLMAEPGSGENFRMPTLSDLETHRVVVTTLSMCRYLCDSEIKPGFFTHIFLDEAAQAMECESLLPLSLAGETTRIVLAGDHMQLSPEVCSEFVKQRDLHRSLLERLHDVYPADFPCKILLCENYRSHEAIIGLTSELFYDSKLVASGKQPAHGQFYPLTFFTAKGEEVQHVNSTGFYNMAEIYELVDRVEELQKTWPASWGELNESSIGIVAPYSDQVVRIRSELRKRKMFRVSVERVLNVQGKQFRAILLSTVRTRLTCNTDVAMEDLLDFGFLSNVKLVNMAITRAQSLVAVVGDPMSLCAVGKCRKVWEHFVKLCSTNNSLHGTTWEQVRLQLDGLEMKRTYVLNPNAIEFVPNRLRHGVPLTARDVFEPYPFNPRPHHPDYLHSYYPQVMFPYPTMPHYGPAFPIYPPALMMQQRFHRSPHGAHRSGKSHRLSPVQRGYKTASPPAQRRGSPSDGVRHPPEGEATGASRTPPPMNRKTANRYPRGHLSNGAVPIHHPGAMPFFTQMPYGMFVPEDPRMYMYHGGGYPGHFPGFLPMGPIPYPIPRYLPPFQSGPYHGPMYHGGPVEERHGSPNSNRSTPASQYSGPPSRPASGDQRAYSPASSPNSFQQVQLLPNVKHAPAHLVGQEDSGQPANMATDLNPQGKTAPSRSRPNRPVKEREKRRLANGPGPHSQRDRTNKPDLSLEATLNTSQPALPRQLSEELQTPTQIHDLMKMIDESTLESPKKQLHNHPLGKAFISPSKVGQGSPGSSCGIPFSPPQPVTTNDHSSAQGKELRLNISLANTRPAEKPSPRSGAGGPMVSPPSTLALPEKNEKPTYAGVLRRPPPSPQPQTPVTPAVFPTSPRDQMGNDAMDILRNLNFKASPGTQALYQYFS